MANNIINFPAKSGGNEMLGKKVQVVESPEKAITSDLREQLRNECRSRYGYSKQISE